MVFLNCKMEKKKGSSLRWKLNKAIHSAKKFCSFSVFLNSRRGSLEDHILVCVRVHAHTHNTHCYYLKGKSWAGSVSNTRELPSNQNSPSPSCIRADLGSSDVSMWEVSRLSSRKLMGAGCGSQLKKLGTGLNPRFIRSECHPISTLF